MRELGFRKRGSGIQGNINPQVIPPKALLAKVKRDSDDMLDDLKLNKELYGDSFGTLWQKVLDINNKAQNEDWIDMMAGYNQELVQTRSLMRQLKEQNEVETQSEEVDQSSSDMKQAEEYVRSRQELLVFGKKCQQEMEFFTERSKSLAKGTQLLVDRATKGEQGMQLQHEIAELIKTAEEMRKLAYNAHEKNGATLVKGRQQNANSFITKNPKLAQEMNFKYTHIFEEVSLITKQFSELYRGVKLELTAAIHSLNLILPLAKGNLAVNDIVQYLDELFQYLLIPKDQLDHNIDIRLPREAIQELLEGPKKTDKKGDKNIIQQPEPSLEVKKKTFSQNQLIVETRKNAVKEAIAAILQLCGIGIQRVLAIANQHPQLASDPQVKQRFETLKKENSNATELKRKFDMDLKEFDKLVLELEKKLG